MAVPSEARNSPRRVELIFYCTEPKPEYLETMRLMAHFPHDYQTFFGMGHTIPNGDPPAPIWGHKELNSLLFIPSIVSPDNELPKQLVLGGDAVDFLWMVPLSHSECNLTLARGTNAILELFSTNLHPHVFTGGRESYI